MAISSGTERVRRNGAKTPLLLRRVLHDCERRSLSLEAQGIVYKCLAGEEVELEVIERAIQEAVSISFLKHSSVDAPLFEAIMDAVIDDVSFEIPGSSAGRAYAQSSRVC